MKRTAICTMVLTVALLAMESLAVAGVPYMINYQGWLTDNTGSPVDATILINFTIYKDSTGAAALWSEVHQTVEVDSGAFSVVLGSVVPIDDSVFVESQSWLGIQIGNDPEVVPRTRLSSVPYAYQTLRADTADVGAGWATKEQQKAGYLSVYVHIDTARVGIGTNNPQAKLHVYQAMAYYDYLRIGGSLLLVKDYGNVGIGVENPVTRLDINEPGATDPLRVGVAGAAKLIVKNDGSVGIGTELPAAKLDVEETGSLDPFRVGVSSSTKLIVTNDGDVGIGATDPGNHKLYVTSSGAGVSGSTAKVENTNPNGIAMTLDNTSSDLGLLVAQHGDGPIFRCDSWTGGWHPVFTVENNGRTKVRGILEVQNLAGATVMEMGEGLDYAEGFNVSDPDVINPGAVLVIDPDNPGKLTRSSQPYDSKVAGIAAGANGVGSGVRLGAGQFDYDVALAGRVYCNVDANEAGIEPGDLLTTSTTPGYAMKATDYRQAQGAILGKAMQRLERGRIGQILVLVTLQ